MTVAAVLAVLSPATAKTPSPTSAGAWSCSSAASSPTSVARGGGHRRLIGHGIASVSAPLLAALILLYVGAVVSAFASTTAILGALIPLAVPLLVAGELGAVALVMALSISASVVDSSPFSTNGALVVANAPDGRGRPSTAV